MYQQSCKDLKFVNIISYKMSAATKKINFAKTSTTTDSQKSRAVNRVQSLKIVTSEKRHKRSVQYLTRCKRGNLFYFQNEFLGSPRRIGSVRNMFRQTEPTSYVAMPTHILFGLSSIVCCCQKHRAETKWKQRLLAMPDVFPKTSAGKRR